MAGFAVPRLARLVTGSAVGLMVIAGASVARDHQAHPASLSPRGAAGAMTAVQASAAARACARFAADAGWANDGAVNGALVTAVAVCVAESGGRPVVYQCDANGTDGAYPPVKCPTGSYDRGLWQLNSQFQPQVNDPCAFRGQCNAAAAYLISGRGANFAPWAVYDTGAYTRYLPDAQAAVTALRTGAVASALAGACVASRPAAGNAVVTAWCGPGVAAQRWTVAGTTVTQRGRCLTAPAAQGQPVTLAPCAGAASQAWAASPAGQLRDSHDGLCLTVPAAGPTPGGALSVAACGATMADTWWLP